MRRTRSARNAEPARGAIRATGLQALPDELLARVFVRLPSIRDFGRVDCVCRAWRARGSPVEQALRERIEASGKVMPAPVAGCATHRMCWLELLRQARTASGRISASSCLSAAVDKQGQLRVWGKCEGEDDLADHDGYVVPQKTLVPKVIESLSDRRVVAIAVTGATYGSNLIVQSDEGTVFAWFFSDSGDMGPTQEPYAPGCAPPRPGDCFRRRTSTESFRIHGGRDGVGGAF